MRSRGADLGRFAEPAMLVLVSLSDAPKHGYAIMADVAAFSGSQMGPGTLYAVLARLEDAGHVEPLASEDRRRPYRITPAGSTAMRDQLDAMQRLVRVGRLRARGARS
jgi:DNA-binding PadR family transcriptional regulator